MAYPNRIDILPYGDWNASTGTAPAITQAWNVFGGGYVINTGGVVNDAIAWKVLLDAGTWKLDVQFFRMTDRGIATVKMDAATWGTIDFYGASAANTVGNLTGFVVATPAVYTMDFQMLTKNASSTGYLYALQWITLLKTA